jgi:hypothetical protein
LTLARIAVIALLVLALGASAAQALPGYTPPNQRLEMAQEEHGHPAAPGRSHDLPAGTLTVSPTQLVAARAGQTVRFTVSLDHAVPGATLHVLLPARWLDVPASRLPAIRAPRLHATAGGRARLRRAGRDVALVLDGAAAGATASFDVTDVGIPAGTYDLRFRWVDDATGRAERAGTASVRFLAPSRDTLNTGLTVPGIDRNASNDSLEESETFIAAVPGNKDRVAASINWNDAAAPSTLPAWITNDGGVSWTGPLSMPETLDVPGSSSPESASICCDPTLAADPLGNVWVGGLSFDKSGPIPGRAVVNRIAAGTNAFRTQTTGLPTGGVSDADKPMMTIDNSPNSPTFGRLYMVWDQLPSNGSVNVVISQCDTRPGGVANAANCDNADQWTAPVAVASNGSYIYADVAVGPDGRVYVTWWDYSNVNAIHGDVCAPATQDCASAGAWSGSPAVHTIATLDATGGTPLPFACPILAQPGGRASTAPSVEVDRSGGPNDDRVYVSWSDLRAGSGTTRCADGAAPQSTHLTFDPYVASASGGALPGSAAPSSTVGTRLLVDGEGGGQSNSDDWFAWLTIDQTTGQAWTDFYSTRDSADRQTTNFYARSVTPSGASHTLGPLTKVSSGASDYSGDPCCNFGNDYGDYTGIDATSGAAFPVWSDNSSGSHDGEAFAFARSAASGGLPTPVTGAASAILQSAATLNGTVNPHGQASTYSFEWGTTTVYGQQTADQSAGSATSPQPATASLDSLTPGTKYHYRLLATDGSGASASEDRSFTTAAAQKPSVTTSAASSVTGTGATLNGSVNPNGDSTTYHFEYGTTTAYGTSTAATGAGSGTSAVGVSAPIGGLSPATTYHYRVVATNGAGTTNGTDQTFTTQSPPAATTTATTSITTSGATFNGTVNPKGQATTYFFRYGPTTSYGSQTPTQNLAAGSSNVSVSAGVTGLDPDSDYHVELVAQNATGTTFGGDDKFHTLAPPPPATPDVTTGAATSVTDTAATVGGSVNPNGTPTKYHFEYGTTTAYGSSTPDVDAGSGTSTQTVSASLSSLTPDSDYHYRLVATNDGGTANGADAKFHTAPSTPPGQPPTVTTDAATAIGQSSATLNATIDPQGDATTYHFVYGPTTAYGSATGDVSAGSGTGPVAVSTQLSGLDAGTQYHVKAIASNSNGTGEGGDVTFTTASPPPKNNGGGTDTTTTASTAEAPPPPPPADTTGSTPPLVLPVAPDFALTLAPQRPAGVARRGLALSVRCRSACRLDAGAYMTASAARRLGLAGAARTVLLGSGTVPQVATGLRRLTVRLRTAAARRAVGRAATVVLQVRIRARDSTGRLSRVRWYRVTLPRSGRSPSVRALTAAPAWVSWAPAGRLD